MAEIKITIEENGEPITGLTIEDFDNLPSDWVDIKEIEPGVYEPITEDN